jgi:SAM-dependent methyltransferase
MRPFDEAIFDRSFAALASENHWQEEPDYYPRYRSRYRAVLQRLAGEAPSQPIDVLDIGGGQLAFMARALWGDRACVADIEPSCFDSLRGQGIEAFQWDVARDDPPVARQFDAVFFSEVIEHLPVPGHIALRRVRMVMRPSAVLICTTPNLFRLRNIMYLLRGREVFDHFDLPGERGYGHVLEYSAEHLAWQLGRAGFADYQVELEQFTHVPEARFDRMLAKVGAPLLRIPRYRDNLMAFARAPGQNGNSVGIAG